MDLTVFPGLAQSPWAAFLLQAPVLRWDLLTPAGMALVIFLLRAADLTLDTLRTLAVARGRRLFAWVAGFFEAILFLTAFGGVLANLSHPWNLLAFAGGFASGTLFGILIENRMAPGHSLLRILSPTLAESIAESLRLRGFGATSLAGQGQQGSVGYILCYAPRRAVEAVRRLVTEIDPAAFITVENVRALDGGWRS
jgi:uncharacterized protein YebE (UPF0316 family)